MAEYRAVLAVYLAALAPTLGDCPACYGLGQLHKVVGTDVVDNDLVYETWRDEFCGGTSWLRRPGAPTHRPAFALPPSEARSYARAEAQPGAGRRGTLADGNVASGLGLDIGGPSNVRQHRQVRASQSGSQQGRGRAATRREGPSLAEGPEPAWSADQRAIASIRAAVSFPSTEAGHSSAQTSARDVLHAVRYATAHRR